MARPLFEGAVGPIPRNSSDHATPPSPAGPAWVPCPALQRLVPIDLKPQIVRSNSSFVNTRVNLTVVAHCCLEADAVAAALSQLYLHADLALKERALARTAPSSTPGRYRPPDQLLAFLESL